MYSNNGEFLRVYDNFEYLYKKAWKRIEGTTYKPFIFFSLI